MKVRIFSLFLALILICSAAPATVHGSAQWEYTAVDGGLCLTKYCGAETEVTVPARLNGQNVVALGQDSTPVFDETVTSVTIEHGVRTIGDHCFENCTALKRVDLSGSVNTIGARAFAHTGLISMTVPGSVHTIGREAFLGCEKLYDMIIDSGVGTWPCTEIGPGLGSGSVELLEGLTVIEDRAFFDCVNLTMMAVPSTVTAIGEQALGWYEKGGSLHRIGAYTISGYADTTAQAYAKENGLIFTALDPLPANEGACGLDVTWSLKDGVLTLTGSGRMYDCLDKTCLPWYPIRDQIRTVILEAGVGSLGDFAFSDCTNLKTVEFRGNAPIFGKDVFSGDTLTAVYPAGDSTWTRDVMQNYGGNVKWTNGTGLPFTDVPADSFYYDPVAWAVEKGITTGVSATTFDPNGTCMRAQVVTFLWRAMGCPKPQSSTNPFVDVDPSHYFYDAVLWAVEHGVTTGMDATHFSPTESCNRAQVVTFLWRAMGKPEAQTTQSPFTDVEPGQWYGVPVLWAVEKGITNGMGDGTFGVNTVCNRAQVVTFLYRAMLGA